MEASRVTAKFGDECLLLNGIIVRFKLKKGSYYFIARKKNFLHIHSAIIVYESLSLLGTLATVIKN